MTALIEITLTTIIILVSVWIYRDARKRKMWALLWAYMAIIIPVIGWIAYMLLRKPLIEKPCSDCQERFDSGDPSCRNCQYNFTLIAEERGLIKTYKRASFPEKIKSFFAGVKYLCNINRGKDKNKSFDSLSEKDR